MKKLLFVIAMVLCSLTVSAQSVVNTEDGKYNVYCDVMGYNFWGFGKVKVQLDMGAVADGKGAFESLYDENGKKIKFNTMMDAINYMAKRGWRVHETFVVSESNGLKGYQNVIHYLLEKKVSNDNEIREGLITRDTD